MDSSKLIFISHATEDKRLADAICQYIEARGLRCWLAHRDIPIGANFGKAVGEVIPRCSSMIVVLSTAAGTSDYVGNEVASARELNIPILPFRIEEVEYPHHLPLFLQTTQTLDASKGRPQDYFPALYAACAGEALFAARRPKQSPPLKKSHPQKSRLLWPLMIAGGAILTLAGTVSFVLSTRQIPEILINNKPLPGAPPDTQSTRKPTPPIHHPAISKIDPVVDSLDGAIYSEPSSTDELSFNVIKGNTLHFSWKVSIYTLSGKMKLEGNRLEVTAGDAEGYLTLVDNGAGIKGSLTIKSTGVPHKVNLTRQP